MNNLWIKTLKFNEPSIQWFYISLFSKFIIANPCTLRKRRSQLKMMGITLVDLPDGQSQWYPREKSHNHD